MSNLTEPEKLLSECAKQLEGAASQIKKSELDSSSSLQDIGAALSHISSVQQAIYKIEPYLEPDFLKVKSLHSKHNKLFTAALAKAASLCESQQFDSAISLFEESFSTNPSKNLAQTAESEISRIVGIAHINGYDP